MPTLVSETSPAIRAIPKSVTRNLAVGSEHQVRRLDVAVDDACRVRGIERATCLLEPGKAERRRNAARAHPVGQRSAREELHHDRGLPGDVGDVEDRDHVRLGRQPRRDPCLAREPRPDLRVAREALVQDLDRDPAIERVIGRRVDVGHAARRDQLGPAVARRKRERGCGHPAKVPLPRRCKTIQRSVLRHINCGWQVGHQ